MPKGTCPPETEVNGLSVRAFMESINHEEFRAILEKYGFESGIENDHWYSLQDVLAALTEIASQPGGGFDLVSIGIAAADLTPLSSEVQQLPLVEFLKLYSQAFADRHRNGDAGTITAEQIGEHHVKMTLDVYYPDDMMYGILYGFVRCFLPDQGRFTIKYDDDHVRKDQGGDTTIIHVRWE